MKSKKVRNQGPVLSVGPKFRAWMNATFPPENHELVSASKVYRTWNLHCRQNDMPPSGVKAIARAMRVGGYEFVRKNTGMFIVGHKDPDGPSNKVTAPTFTE
jgi:hypothetical protein